MASLPEHRMRVRHELDGSIRELHQARCPLCGTWAEIDDDQFRGRVSMQCATPGCPYHETHDLSAGGRNG